jgi:hypothetical protein
LGLSLQCCSYAGEIVINELFAASSDRLVRRDGAGVDRLGVGPAWHAPDFDDAHWQVGTGPFGFGHPGLGTNLEGAMKSATPSLYLRRTFEATAGQAAAPGGLDLWINYDDGMVVYLNGVELARRHLGVPGSLVHADQPSFNKRLQVTPERIQVTGSAGALRPGSNVLAIQVHNTWPIADLFPFDATLLASATLALSSSPATLLVGPADPWRYAPGVIEPSGGWYDPSLIGSGEAFFSDWVELRNTGSTAVALGGWMLSLSCPHPQSLPHGS